MRFSNRWNFFRAVFQSLELFALAALVHPAAAQDPATNRIALTDPAGGWRAEVSARGIHTLSFPRSNGWSAVRFRDDAFAGPTWQLRGPAGWHDIALRPVDPTNCVYEAVDGPLRFGLRYEVLGRRLGLLATLKNESDQPVGPLQAGLRLGLDTYMEKFPDWRTIPFPTLLRCEPTHCWGYFMSPEGRLLGLASPDPVAGWRLEYKPLRHRIYTASLDLLCPPPLPPRHPQDLHTLAPGQTRLWRLTLEDIATLDEVPARLAASAGGPVLQADRYTVPRGTTTRVRVQGPHPVTGTVRGPAGPPAALEFAPAPAGGWEATVPLDGPPGLYEVRVEDARRRVACATLAVRHPWSWYLQRARAEAVAKPQKASSHTESWYGLFSAFHARRLFPDPALDAAAEAKFQEIWPLMYDPATARPKSWADRIQNHACAAGLLAARYRATRDPRDLEQAAVLCDFLLERQSADGAYRNQKTHYTSVVYIGKSILEVMAEERRLARTNAAWQARFDRHYDSVRRAMDELERSRDNIQTEGELTYEDGMISCSAAQLALFALWQTNEAERVRYTEAARDLADGHRCLSQLVVPDARQHGGSLRFWESQYDVLATPNMLSSPHGWSAWRIYAQWYLYRLTGEAERLRDVQDALGAGVQLIDPDSGELRWAFVSDPRVEATLFEPDPAQPGRGRGVPRVIGEQYLPMISGWYRAPSNTWVTGYWGRDGGSCDNDVHEMFKCLEEVALTVCHVVEGPGTTFTAYNGTARLDGAVLVVEPAEACVTGVHVNLRWPRTVRTVLGGHPFERRIEHLGWLGRAPSL